MKSMHLLGLLGLGIVLVGCGGGDRTTSEDAEVAAGAATTSECVLRSPTPCTPQAGNPIRKRIADSLRRMIRADLTNAATGVAPPDADVLFVFKTLTIQENRNVADGAEPTTAAFVDARIVKRDGITDFDFAGTVIHSGAASEPRIETLTRVPEAGLAELITTFKVVDHATAVTSTPDGEGTFTVEATFARFANRVQALLSLENGGDLEFVHPVIGRADDVFSCWAPTSILPRPSGDACVPLNP